MRSRVPQMTSRPSAGSADFTSASSLPIPYSGWRVFAGVFLVHVLVIANIAGNPWSAKPHKRLSAVTIELGVPNPFPGTIESPVDAPPPLPVPSAAERARPASPPPKATPVPAVSAVSRPDPAMPDEATPAPTASEATVAQPAQPAMPMEAPPVASQPDRKASYLNNPVPRYPSAALLARAEGTVRIKAEVLPDGTPGRIMLAHGSGDDLLDRAALDAVAQWKFTPARTSGQGITEWVEIPITFKLKKGKFEK